jgi:hypothetical protein
MTFRKVAGFIYPVSAMGLIAMEGVLRDDSPLQVSILSSFSSSLTLLKNKLERLCFPSFFSGQSNICEKAK